MRRSAIATGLAVLLALVLAAPGGAITFKKKVAAGGTKSFTVDLFSPGLMSVNLTWSKKTADLDLILLCDTPFTAVSSGGEEDRNERMSVGHSAASCTLTVSSFVGGSPFWLNIQTTAGPLVPAGASLEASEAEVTVNAAGRVGELVPDAALTAELERYAQGLREKKAQRLEE